MKILVINGSPKGERSNTLRLTNAFLEGLNEHEENDIAVISTSELQIAPCKGCFACWSKTPGKCCIKDDMGAVIEKMLWADLTIWSFPLYYFSVPGSLKNLIDRQLPMSTPFMDSAAESGGHPPRYDMTGKRTMVISTCGFYTAKGNYDGVINMFDHFKGAGNYDTLFCGQGELFRVKELTAQTGNYLALVRCAGSEYAAGRISAEVSEQLEHSIFPRETFEAMADASWGVGKEGEEDSEAKIFTRQMSALYNKASYPGHDRVLEINYTDIGESYRILLGKDGSRLLKQDEDGAPTTVINTPYSVWKAIAAGEIEGSAALMQHKYTVDGDFDLLVHWDDNFGGSSGKPKVSASGKKEGKTNMLIMLLPWMVLWTAASLNTLYGSFITLAVCALIPLLFYRNKKTPYDVVSSAAVSGAALALLLGAPERMVLPLSYLAFGLLWGVSCLFRIPLTAHYSMNQYGEEAALKNPIFMKTNRILTALWSILYLVTAAVTYLLMDTPIADYIGLINSAAPAIMGIFTAWYQKWYPARVAKGK